MDNKEPENNGTLRPGLVGYMHANKMVGKGAGGLKRSALLVDKELLTNI